MAAAAQEDSTDVFFKHLELKEIVVTGFNVTQSKYQNNGKNCLKLQFEHKGIKHVLFTGSNVLINQIERYQKEIPFISTIKKVDKFYTFS